MSLEERIAADLTRAMKARDGARTSVLRMAKAALKNRTLEKRSALDDGEELKVLQGLVKQREEAARQFRSAGRTELADKEEAEAGCLRGYLPQEASDEEIAAAVEAALAETGASSAAELGKVMKAALGALRGLGKPVDGGKVNRAVRQRLGG